MGAAEESFRKAILTRLFRFRVMAREDGAVELGQMHDLSGTRQKTISAIENGSEGTKLGTLLGVIAILDLDLQVVPRHKDSKSIEDIF